jgi:hypothetical protein
MTKLISQNLSVPAKRVNPQGCIYLSSDQVDNQDSKASPNLLHKSLQLLVSAKAITTEEAWKWLHEHDCLGKRRVLADGWLGREWLTPRRNEAERSPHPHTWQFRNSARLRTISTPATFVISISASSCTLHSSILAHDKLQRNSQTTHPVYHCYISRKWSHTSTPRSGKIAAEFDWLGSCLARCRRI